MRPPGPGRIEIETQSAESNAPRVTVTLRIFTTTLIAMRRWVGRAVVAVKLWAWTTMALLGTRRQAFAMHWRAVWRTWSAKVLRRRHATFKATIRALPHQRRPTTLFIAA